MQFVLFYRQLNQPPSVLISEKKKLTTIYSQVVKHTAPSSPAGSSFAPCNGSQYTALRPQPSALWHWKVLLHHAHSKSQSLLHQALFSSLNPSTCPVVEISETNSLPNPFPSLLAQWLPQILYKFHASIY